MAQTTKPEGFGRLGTGGSDPGGTQACFQLPGAASKYRLGNECEIYWELGLRQQLYQSEDGAEWFVYGMASLFNAYGHAPTFADENGAVRLPQLWTGIKLPSLKGATLWMGRRYYKRHDIHMNDFFYWAPNSTGAGIENFQLGEGKLLLSYAISRKDNMNQPHPATRHDLNLGGIGTNPGGAVELGLSFIQRSSSVDGAHSGWSLSAQHKQSNFFGGANVFAIQYGEGPGTGLGGTAALTRSQAYRSLRVLESPQWQVTPRFGGQILVLYQRDYAPDDIGQSWRSLGLRPSYALTRRFILQGELTQDRVRPDHGPARNLRKFTIAPTLKLAGMGLMDRPELRIYWTHANWNEAAQEAATPGSSLSDSGTFGTNTHGSTFGVQFETWW